MARRHVPQFWNLDDRAGPDLLGSGLDVGLMNAARSVGYLDTVGDESSAAVQVLSHELRSSEVKLGALLDQMSASGIVVTDDPLVLNVARELKILQVAGGAQGRFLRIVEAQKGQRDFANLRFLQSRLGHRINCPTQIVACDDLVCGVFPFVPHEKVSYARLASGRLLQEVAESLALMHEAGREFSQRLGAKPDQAGSPVAGVDVCDGDSAATAWLQSTLSTLSHSHVPVAQHCDFTYANLGVSNQGQLVIFDWEEYGAVTFPAFDLTTFLLGHYHFGGTIGAALDSPDSLIGMINRDFGASYLSRFDMTAETYMRLFPAYLLVFRTLKLNDFGHAINRRVQAMWARLRKSGAWSDILGMS